MQVAGDLFCRQPGVRVQCEADDPDGNGFINITSIEDLNNMRYNLPGVYELTKNLDFTDPSSYLDASNMANLYPHRG